jgi:elongation factor P
MAILAYNEILAKKVIVFNDEPCVVVDHHVFRKQQRKPVNITKLKGLVSGRAYENTFHVSETAQEADLEKRPITFVYESKGEYWFHEQGEPSKRFTLPHDLIGDQAKFIKPKSDIDAVLYDEKIIGVKVPIKVELKVTQAMEAVKGNTSSGATKEVTLETGATVFVPMFINEGDIIAINTETASYSERVSKS